MLDSLPSASASNAAPACRHTSRSPVAVDHDVGQDRAPSLLSLEHHAGHALAVADRIHRPGVQQQPDARLGQHLHRLELQPLRVDQRRPGHDAAERAERSVPSDRPQPRRWNPTLPAGAPATAAAGSRPSTSEPKPAITCRPLQSVMRSIQITKPAGRQPAEVVVALHQHDLGAQRRAARAAAQPAGPPPTTRTSVIACTGVSRGGS